MSHAVLALGGAVVTVAGCVWYVPALADLRAGSDRPVSRRTAAASCLSGWGTAGVIAVLLLVAESWWLPGATAVAGTVTTAAFRMRAITQRRDERREAARHWAALDPTPPRHARGDDSARYVFSALLGCGLAAAVSIAAVAVTAGPEAGGDWLVVATAPAGVVGLSVGIAAAYLRGARRRTPTGPTRAPR